MSILLSVLPVAIASFASDARNTTLVQEVAAADPYLLIAPEYGTVYQGDGISVSILSTELQSFELPRSSMLRLTNLSDVKFINRNVSRFLMLLRIYFNILGFIKFIIYSRKENKFPGISFKPSYHISQVTFA